MDSGIVPDHKLHVFARDDDYFFGVLHSRTHEAWSLAQCSWMGVGNDPSYSSSRTFKTFPFPWPPSQEVTDDPRVQAIAQTARELVQLRDAWLGVGAKRSSHISSDAAHAPSDTQPGIAAASTGNASPLPARTLTNLYNARPTWLDNAHRKLDAAVFAAYGWPATLSDEEILARLLALNLARAAGK
jgi:type II restriction/modification system DNA methylase subunit YeeA